MDGKIIFSDTRKTKTVELPSFPGTIVTIYTELNIGQQRAIANAKDDFERGLAAAETAIKDWNLYEDEFTKLAITTENLKKFPERDMLTIFAAVANKTVEELLEEAKGKAIGTVLKKNIAAE